MKKLISLAKAIVMILVVMTSGAVFAQTPSTPSPIVGEETVCVGHEYTFSINEIDYAEVIVWRVSEGLIILSGYNTVEIVVYVDSIFDGGPISVYGWNRTFHYGRSVVFDINVRALPSLPPPIVGETNLVVGQQYTFELHDIIGMGPYIWTVPDWMTIVEGQETNTLVVEVTGQGSLDLISVVRTNECGSSEPVSLKVSTTTGVADFESVGLNLYPNPVDDFICIDGIASETSIQILDQTGRVVFTRKYAEKINVSGLKPGMYVVVIITNKYMVSHKIVKL